VAKRLTTTIASVALGAISVALVLDRPAPKPLHAARGIARWSQRAQQFGDEELDAAAAMSSGMDRSLVLPTGAPASLGCEDARSIVAQARGSIASEPPAIDPAKFSEATSDWLDPHGLWSVAPDSPVGGLLKRSAERLLAEIQAPPKAGTECVVSREIGRELASWIGELRRVLDEGVREASETKRHPSLAEAFKLASSTPFQDGTVTRSGRELARTLGREIGAVRAAYGEQVASFADAARARAAPELDSEAWSRVVIAASVRAFIPQLDAHGAWAPADEEISIYDLSLESEPPARLWSEMTRTALGVRIDRSALAPLQDGDVVLRVHDVALAGVSVEQAEQLSVIEGARPDAEASVTILRAGEPHPLTLALRVPSRVVPEADPAAAVELPLELVRYGDGRSAVIGIHEVPDDLGSRLEATLDRARKSGRDLRGVLLDLRANGGGSTDGAIAALGVFLPGASLFPMKRRDGGIEVERAPELPADRQWTGPVAVLVDGDSASAAEMIAGALSSYRRAIVVGDRTYGKGCAQEYLDDDAHAGVLRLTTLLYALPDGAPVQKTGIIPHLRLSFPGAFEREAQLKRALEPWRGPDVRDGRRGRDVAWNNHAGRVGPCKEALVCRALRALGSSPAAARSAHPRRADE
jgi:carboxyl-terminal processing protease